MDEFCVTKDGEEETTMVWTAHTLSPVFLLVSGVPTGCMERFGEDSFRLSAKFKSGPQVMVAIIILLMRGGPHDKHSKT